MYGLNGALPISLQINSPTQLVGQQPTYRIANATPGAQVLWSSYLNGQDTHEVMASYGQAIEANGSLEIAGGNWRDSDVGVWQKEITITNPDGTVSRAAVTFQVVQPQAASVPIVNTGADFFSTPLFNLGSFEVTPVVLGVGLVVWMLFGGKRR